MSDGWIGALEACAGRDGERASATALTPRGVQRTRERRVRPSARHAARRSRTRTLLPQQLIELPARAGRRRRPATDAFRPSRLRIWIHPAPATGDPSFGAHDPALPKPCGVRDQEPDPNHGALERTAVRRLGSRIRADDLTKGSPGDHLPLLKPIHLVATSHRGQPVRDDDDGLGAV
jgi:hypothetical protein